MFYYPDSGDKIWRHNPYLWMKSQLWITHRLVASSDTYCRRYGACTGNLAAPMLRAIRMSNKYLLNPVMGALAGRKISYSAAIRHTGRKSGKEYSTPVGADPTPDGFIIPVAYGTQVDWLKNVLAAGRATVSAKGETYEVTEPELIDAATALPMLPSKRRRNYERIGIEQYLKVTTQPDYR